MILIVIEYLRNLQTVILMYNKLKKAIYVTITLLIGYLSWDFANKESRNFPSLNYDWSKERVVNDFGYVTIDSFSDNYLKLKVAEEETFQPTNTFSIYNEAKSYYFRFRYVLLSKNNVVFKDLFWLNDQPETGIKNFKLKEVDLPIKSVLEPKIVTIGDELLFQNEAKYFRREINRRINIKFVGNHKDLFGYEYYYLDKINFSLLNKEFYNVPKAQNILIFFKPSNDIEDELLSLQQLIDQIDKNKNVEKIIVMSIPIFDENKINYMLFNKKIPQLKNHSNKVVYFDVNKFLKVSPSNYRDDKNEISKQGYEKLAKEVSKLF